MRPYLVQPDTVFAPHPSLPMARTTVTIAKMYRAPSGAAFADVSLENGELIVASIDELRRID